MLSTAQDGKRRAVGRILFPLEGELGQAGRVLWRDLETEEDTQVRTGKQPGQNLARTHSNACDLSQCSELGDVQISLCYSPALQRLSVVVLRARGLQPLTDAGLQTLHGLPEHL